MRNVTLAALAVVAVAAGLSSSLAARQQATQRFQYLELEPFATYVNRENRNGYRACVAEAREWNCREFERPEFTPPVTPDPWQRPKDPALRDALATLGSEGWELVSTIDDTPDRGTTMVYVFKRPF